MELNLETNDIDEKFFGIEDPSFIYDILRSKLYSDPIAAICREISCNARDAHREVGKDNVPIEITLPTYHEQFIKIKDYGPGLSPDRINDVYLKYAASTKKNDNKQTGSFGIGAKCPFSYSDTFSIITNYNGIQYNYSAFIDPTKIGKVSLIQEFAIDEPNGTTIIVPVKYADFGRFNSAIEFACRHWDIKPIIHANSISWKKELPFIETNNWKLCASSKYNYNVNIFAIIDGIQYDIDISTLGKIKTASLPLQNCNVYLSFNNGELSLSASREQIYLDQLTCKKIKEKIDLFLSELSDKFDEQLSLSNNLYDAMIYYKNNIVSKYNYSFSPKNYWNNIPLNFSFSQFCPVVEFNKKKKYNTNEKIYRSVNIQLNFIESSELYINDLDISPDDISFKHVKKQFDNLDIKNIQIICPNEKWTLPKLNEQFYIDKMGAKLLSDIVSIKKIKPKENSERTRFVLFKLNTVEFSQTNIASYFASDNNKILCYLDDDKNIINENNCNLNINLLNKLSKNNNVEFYGVNISLFDKVNKNLGKIKLLKEYILEIIDHTIDYTAIKYAYYNKHNIKSYITTDKLIPLINKSDSDVFKTKEMLEKIEPLAKNKDILDFYETIVGSISDEKIKEWVENNQEYDIDVFMKKYKEKYPLINLLNKGYYFNINDHLKDISDYINMIDSL